MESSTVDWAALRAVAVAAMEHAYVPYSRFPVGVAGLVDDGRVVSGCNVENASYGLPCAPSAAWSRRCTPRAVAGCARSCASTGTATT